MYDTRDAAVSPSGSSSPCDANAQPAGVAPARPGISVLVVSNIRLFREGIAQALSHHSTIASVATASGQDDAIALILRHRQDVVVVDVATTAQVNTVCAIQAAAPTAAIVAFGVAEAENDVLACAERGVSGYVTRDGTLADVVAAIQDASRGELHCSPGLAAAMFKRLGTLASGRHTGRDVSRLTPRESEVLAGLQQGLSNKAIAWRLGIEQATVKNHVHNVLEKLKIRRRSEVAARANLSRADGPATGQRQ